MNSLCVIERFSCRAAPRSFLQPLGNGLRTPAPLTRLGRGIASTRPNANDNGSKNGSKDNDPYRSGSTAAKPSEKHPHEGRFSRTDNQVSFPYPKEENFPRSKLLQGRGGTHMKRTLPSFSMEGRVGVITGGGRGLGLVMAQALVESGADVALVDKNRTWVGVAPLWPSLNRAEGQ